MPTTTLQDILDIMVGIQKGKSVLLTDAFANRPAFGVSGRYFYSTDTRRMYKDLVTSWEECLLDTGSITGELPDNQIPSGITRDSEHGGFSPTGHHVSFVQADHDGLPNPHHSNANDHANTNDPTAGEKAALVGTSGTPGVGNKYVTDADSRNSDARTPTAHKVSHQDAGGDELSVLGLSGLLADAQTPLAHNQAESTITFTDIITGDVSATAHGFAPKHPNDTSKFLRGDGTWGAPTATVLAEFHIPLLELAQEVVI